MAFNRILATLFMTAPESVCQVSWMESMPMMLCNQEPDDPRRGPEDARPPYRRAAPRERPHAGSPGRSDGRVTESRGGYRVGDAEHGGVESAADLQGTCTSAGGVV